MTENTDNLVLEHLRLIRSDMSIIRGDVREMKDRLTSLENITASVKRDIGDLYTEVAGQNARHDRMAERIERIEKRLDLA
jgi:archaellum component FlaC